MGNRLLKHTKYNIYGRYITMLDMIVQFKLSVYIHDYVGYDSTV